MNPHRMLTLSARFILGGVFVYAGFEKILHPSAFAEVVYNYKILPDELINLTAIVLPCLELILGTFLIIRFWMPGTVVLSNLVLITFIGALVFNMARGLDVNCGCFSATAVKSSMNILTVLRDTSFLAIAVYLFYSCVFHKN
ncbi:MAG: MauE/DoxX family redox-associated membrane protein [Desulfobacterales bacterium]